MVNNMLTVDPPPSPTIKPLQPSSIFGFLRGRNKNVLDLPKNDFKDLKLGGGTNILHVFELKQAKNGLQSRSFENGNHGLSRTVKHFQGLSWTANHCK